MNKKKIGIILCIILLLYFIGGIIYNYSGISKRDSKKKEFVNGIQIKDFEYLCHDEQSKLFKEEFKILKSNLESDNIDYSEYAKSISKLFVIDLYTLDNKKNMYDVGGIQFVYPAARDNYKLNVENTLYKYMEDINEGKRKQELPEVSSVIVKDIIETEYNIGEVSFEGYKINIDITYIKDLEYDKTAEIILVKSDKYLYIVEKN